VFSKSKIFKFLKRDCGTIPVAEIINGKIEIFFKHKRFLIATESSKYLLIFVPGEMSFIVSAKTFTSNQFKILKKFRNDCVSL
jgi:hypothetical protein